MKFREQGAPEGHRATTQRGLQGALFRSSVALVRGDLPKEFPPPFLTTV